MLHSYTNRQQMRRTEGFTWTNDSWNDIQLNAGWSIGLITKIVNTNMFQSFDEWEGYYLETGLKRQNLLKKVTPARYTQLTDLRGVFTSPSTFKKGLTGYEVDINEAHGRTIDELHFIGDCLYEEVVKRGNPHNLTVNDCFNFTYIRAIDEGYIGIQREVNTFNTLAKACPDMVFRFATATVDRFYAVDIEALSHSGELLCGLQIKSPYFKKGKTAAMKRAMAYNKAKHTKYTNKYDVPAYFVYSSIEGVIENSEVISALDDQLNKVAR